MNKKYIIKSIEQMKYELSDIYYNDMVNDEGYLSEMVAAINNLKIVLEELKK